MLKKISVFLTYVGLSCLVLYTSTVLEAGAETRYGKVEKTIMKGEQARIQIMYSIRASNCHADRIPPKPKIVRAPKLGTLTFSSGRSAPYQCPNIEINVNFADYKSDGAPGVDRFRIRWIASGGVVFDRSYVINIR
ncbi:hypothetical protein DFR52_106178 [Hoeflea marina]|uniref:Uncharacterized protein n=1 Tax=Hoeflea marina TaxID=274592 RepID=A0A317PFT1_9HYPH|nr:hypothetical protein DFR52_106178 [Hoeflea marina]